MDSSQENVAVDMISPGTIDLDGHIYDLDVGLDPDTFGVNNSGYKTDSTEMGRTEFRIEYDDGLTTTDDEIFMEDGISPNPDFVYVDDDDNDEAIIRGNGISRLAYPTFSPYSSSFGRKLSSRSWAVPSRSSVISVEPPLKLQRRYTSHFPRPFTKKRRKNIVEDETLFPDIDPQSRLDRDNGESYISGVSDKIFNLQSTPDHCDSKSLHSQQCPIIMGRAENTIRQKSISKRKTRKTRSQSSSSSESDNAPSSKPNKSFALTSGSHSPPQISPTNSPQSPPSDLSPPLCLHLSNEQSRLEGQEEDDFSLSLPPANFSPPPPLFLPNEHSPMHTGSKVIKQPTKSTSASPQREIQLDPLTLDSKMAASYNVPSQSPIKMKQYRIPQHKSQLNNNNSHYPLAQHHPLQPTAPPAPFHRSASDVFPGHIPEVNNSSSRVPAIPVIPHTHSPSIQETESSCESIKGDNATEEEAHLYSPSSNPSRTHSFHSHRDGNGAVLPLSLDKDLLGMKMYGGRKNSDLSSYRSPSLKNAIYQNNHNKHPRSRSYDKKSRDYFKRNLKLKVSVLRLC